MIQPLALVCYEKLLPGSQLVNRLHDMNYRVQTIADPARLVPSSLQEKPMVIIVDLVSIRHDVPAAIAALRQTGETRHIPVIAIAPEEAPDLQLSAREAGAVLVVSETAILTHLPQFLEQALEME